MSDNGTIVLDGLVLSGGGGGVEEAPTDGNSYVRKDADWENLTPQLDTINTRLNSVEGRGGYLAPYDFLTATPTEEQLNAYALTQISSITLPSEIFNGTRVKNLFNGHLFILTNTPNTEPAVFEWIDSGFDTIGIATNSVAGVVKGSAINGGLTVASDGTAAVTGFGTKYDKAGGVVTGDIIISRPTGTAAVIQCNSGVVETRLTGSPSGIFLYRGYVNRLAYEIATNKWYVYKNDVAKELGITDASELSYSGPVSATNVKGAIENVNTKAEAVIADLESDMNKVFPIISDLGNLSGIEVNVTPEACYKGVANGSFKLVLPIPTDGRTHSFRLFVKAETNASITFNKKIMYDSSITDYGDLISGTYYDYIFTWQPILSKWQMFRKTYQTEPYTLQLLLRFNGNMQDSSPTNLSAGWTPFSGESGVAVDTVNRKFPDDYVASMKKVNAGLVSALADAEKLKAILSAIGTGDFTIGIWVYCPENGVSPAYSNGLFRFVKSNGYENINDFGMPFGWDGLCALGVGNNYDQQHVWWNAGAEVWTQGWHYLEVNRKAGVAYITFDGILKTSGEYTVDVSAGKDNLAYMQLFGWNAGGSTAVSFQEFFILSKASHISDFTPPTAPFVVEQE